MDIVEDFEEFKVNLKEKFLDYAEANQSLIKSVYRKQVLSSLDDFRQQIKETEAET